MAFTETVDPYAAFLSWFQIALLLWIAAAQVGASLSTQLVLSLGALLIGLAHAVHAGPDEPEVDRSDDARKLEQLALDVYPGLDEEDVSVTDTAAGRRRELTEAGRQKLHGEPREDDAAD